MRFALLFLIVQAAAAFVPAVQKTVKTSTQLDLTRRDVVITGIMGLLGAPAIAQASSGSTFFYDDKIEEQKLEPSQQATEGGKLDLNGAPVGDYKVFQGMFPHAAGQIASNGPYNEVSDIYKIKGLTENDKKLFKKYEKYFTVNPPGRAFDERINARVST